MRTNNKTVNAKVWQELPVYCKKRDFLDALNLW